MLRKGLLLFGFVTLIITSIQAQVVPGEMYFADIHLKLTNSLRNELQNEVDELTKSPKYFQIKVDRANLYFPIIEEVFREENLPLDFKYLVLQESALIADAVSVSNAVGFWQFKEFTAKEMGLQIDKNIDERMNIVSSTRAAAGYMRKNNFYFDNWLHALQAYQMGAGGAMKALSDKYYGKKSMTLDNKTYWYVKKFLAHKIAFQYAVDPQKSSTHLIEYKVSQGSSLKEISKETYMDYDELSEYNKWVRKDKIPAGSFSVILPVEGAFSGDVIVANEETPVTEVAVVEQTVGIIENAEGYPKIKEVKNTELKKINGIPGIIAGTDLQIEDVESKYGITEAKFRKFNEILPHEEIIAGNVYYLKKKKSKAMEFYHILQPNESLWDVSQLYGVRVKKLLQKNRIKEEDDAITGLVVWLRNIRPNAIPPEYKEVQVTPIEQNEEIISESAIIVSSVSESDLKPQTDDQEFEFSDEDLMEDDTVMYHMTKKGETLYSISKMYGVGVMEIVDENKLDLQQPLSTGRNLRIVTKKSFLETMENDVKDEVVVEETQISQNINEEMNSIEYVVQPGDTLFKISKEYGVKVDDIKSWNNRTNNNLSPGEKLIIMQE